MRLLPGPAGGALYPRLDRQAAEFSYQAEHFQHKAKSHRNKIWLAEKNARKTVVVAAIIFDCKQGIPIVSVSF